MECLRIFGEVPSHRAAYKTMLQPPPHKLLARPRGPLYLTPLSSAFSMHASYARADRVDTPHGHFPIHAL